jgi:CubicO group peptidase (beta-lactamase class C family)
MKKPILTTLSFLLLGALPACTQNIPAKLDTLIDAYVSQFGFNGGVFVATKGSVIFEKGFGYKNKSTKALNDSNTIFQIGSITKQFTSAIILQLLEQNKLSLQDSLTKYIPDYPNGNKITIEHLLTHTSGIFNYTNDAAFMQNETAHPIRRDSLINRFKHKPLDFPPGQKFSYSNSGYILLGYIIEKVTGQSYFQVVRQRIFQPLHMDHSGFDFTDLNSPDKAMGYAPPESTIPAAIVDSSVSFAAGAIYTTAGDLYKWDRALRAGNIISPASQEKAYTPHLAQYGYGWMIGTVDGKRVIEHGGGITGFTSDIRRVPEDETCIIILDNQPNEANPSKMAQNIASILNGKDVQLPKAKLAITLDTTILRQYVGQYQLRPSFILTITLENGHLFAQATGQGKGEIFAEKKDLFFPKVIDADIEFVRGTDDKVEELILHQNGQHIPAKRL